MDKLVKCSTTLLLIVAVALMITVHFFYSIALLSITLTMVVLAYHFVMRFLVGDIVNRMLKNKINANAKWFSEKSFEAKLYKALRVKKWKNLIPTFSPDSYDLKMHSIEEIIKTTCINEMIHEINHHAELFANAACNPLWTNICVCHH